MGNRFESPRARGWLIVLLFSTSALPACGPSSGVDAGPVDAPGRADAADVGGGGDMLRVAVAADTTGTPVAGAVVALDRPSGERVELTTGADGIATFDVAWADGPFDIIAWVAGRSALANLDVDRAVYESRSLPTGWRMVLLSTTPEPTITVTGTITGASDPMNGFVVTASTGGRWQGFTSSFSIEVPANRPFQLLVSEGIYRIVPPRDITGTIAAQVLTPMQPGAAADTTVDIDLTMNVITATQVTGSFPVPTDASGFFEMASPFVNVTGVGAPEFSLALVPLARFSADGRTLDYEVAYVMPAGVADFRTTYGMMLNGNVSLANAEGVPVSGAQTFELMPVPAVTDPAPGVFPRVFDPVVVTNPIPAAAVGVSVLGAVGPADPLRTRYLVIGQLGAGRIEIPPLPTGADPAVLFAGGLARQVTFCEPSAVVAANSVCRRASYTAPAALDP